MARLASQKLGLAVGVAAGVVLSLATVTVLVLVGNRDSKGGGSARPAPRRSAFYTLRTGDVVRAPLAATRCEASGEAGFPDLFCSRIPRGRYTVTFFSDTIQVWRNGHPDKPAFSALEAIEGPGRQSRP